MAAISAHLRCCFSFRSVTLVHAKDSVDMFFFFKVKNDEDEQFTENEEAILNKRKRNGNKSKTAFVKSKQETTDCDIKV